MAAKGFGVSFRNKNSPTAYSQSHGQMVIGGCQLPNKPPAKINRQAEIVFVAAQRKRSGP